MIVLIIGLILVGILIISMLLEPRNFWNALYMPAALSFFFLGCLIVADPDLQAVVVTGVLIACVILALGLPLFCIINGIVMIKREGHRPQNLLSLFFGIAMIAGLQLPMFGLICIKSQIFQSVMILVLMLEFYFAYAFSALLFYSLLYTYMPKRIRCDYIIVHGCGLLHGDQVSHLLSDRLDKAAEIFRKCSIRPKLVVSGGQGSDETISEAQAMKQYLIGKGFPEEEIIVEDKSSTTYENLKNVRDMLEGAGEHYRYIFVTNNYHVFRTALFAKKLKMKAKGFGCRTAGYYWPSAFIREYIAIMVKYKWIPISIVFLWAAVNLLAGIGSAWL